MNPFLQQFVTTGPKPKRLGKYEACIECLKSPGDVSFLPKEQTAASTIKVMLWRHAAKRGIRISISEGQHFCVTGFWAKYIGDRPVVPPAKTTDGVCAAPKAKAPEYKYGFRVFLRQLRAPGDTVFVPVPEPLKNRTDNGLVQTRTGLISSAKTLHKPITTTKCMREGVCGILVTRK